MESNVVENVSNNYCSIYNCWEVKKELYEIIKQTNEKKYFILKELVSHFGRIIEEESNF